MKHLLDVNFLLAVIWSNHSRLLARMAAARDQDFALTAVTVEEELRGWLAEIASTLDFQRQVGAYRKLVGLVRFFNAWRIVNYDEAAAAQTRALRRARVRIGTMDLKIASITCRL